MIYLIHRLTRQRSPVWDYILGYTDDNEFIHDVMIPHCCADTGAHKKAMDQLRTTISNSDDEDNECVYRLLHCMRVARETYQKKGVPLNTGSDHWICFNEFNLV